MPKKGRLRPKGLGSHTAISPHFNNQPTHEIGRNGREAVSDAGDDSSELNDEEENEDEDDSDDDIKQIDIEIRRAWGESI